MKGKLQKTFLIILIFLLIKTLIPQQQFVLADEEEDVYSINSPETFIYDTHVEDTERKQLFNKNWSFKYGEQSNAELNEYDDSSWETVQIPHDYSLSLPYTQAGEAESGYKLGGVGWYRKSFSLSESAQNKRVLIDFGGVYMNATVYINGHKLGDHPYGYTPFAYDLTDYLNEDGENVIAVRVNHKFPSSRWYSGSGIYRNVHLIITDDVYIDRYGVNIETPNLEKQMGATIDTEIETAVSNDSDDTKQTTINQHIREKGTDAIIASGENEAEIKSQETSSIPVSLKVDNPKLWSTEDPTLYEVVTEVIVEGEVVDEVVTDFGFRTFDFDVDTGFTLNGEPMKLQGVSMHSDQGSLGAAAHERAMERQIEIMQDMGVNAIRVTHNPAADDFIDIANRKGMLIIDEAFDGWVDSKNGNSNDYAAWFDEKIGDNPLLGAESDMSWAQFDIESMVHRGKNAPSIISWSIGNEVMEGNSGPYDDYPNIATKLAEWVKDIDQTRPSTIGDNKLKANWQEAIDIAENLTNVDGTVGFNYADGAHYDSLHEAYPDWKIYGAETASSINSRGVYKPSNYDRHLTSYDESTVGWGKLSADSWYDVITRDFVAGEFVWTGFDYLGEPTPWNNIGSGATGAWPSPKSSYFGIVDTAGLPKDRFYFYQSQWREDVDTLHVLPAWKEDMVEIKDGNVRVDVYSNAASVELFFEDEAGDVTSLGEKKFTEHTTDAGYTYQIYEGDDKKSDEFRNLYFTWDVPYEDGSVYAKAYDADGNEITDTEGRNRVTTFGEAKRLDVNTDRNEIVANGRDLSYITIDVKDEDGNTVEDAEEQLQVDVVGDGKLLALDNGNQLDHEPYDSEKRETFSGKLVAIVQSTKDAGEMKVQIDGEGIESSEVTITTTEDPENTGSERTILGYSMPKNYYVKLGHEPELVSETTVRFTDKTEETASIDWDIEEGMFDEAGTTTVHGKVEEYGLLVFANVTVIESVGALLNYSVATSTGTDQVNLPSSRPLILEDGEVLPTEFPVEWEEQDKSNYEEEGIVSVTGFANVFGESIEVTASIRVSDADVSLSENIAGNNLTLSQSIPKDLQSDNLEAIVDGSTDFETVGEGESNPSIWTNYDLAQTGDNEAEIIFTYATAQYLGSVDLFYYQDSWSADLPDDVEFYWSNDGTENANWTKIENVEETIGDTTEGTPNVTPANYRFNGVPAVGFKIVLRSDPERNSNDVYPAVGLTEVELRTENSSLKEYTEATLDDILLNGKSVPASQLENKVIKTGYDRATVETKSDKNVATTVLEPFENVIRIITESEDHESLETYAIHLGDESASGDLEPDDDARDYPYKKTSAIAGAYHENHDSEGDPNFAVDGDGNTIFHTPWGGTDKENFWITVEMEDEVTLDALRYLSRSGNSNGIVKDYLVEVSLDNETWEEVSVGQWAKDNDTWSIALFDEPIKAKYVRLTGKSTYGDGAQADQFMTAKEIRLRMADEKHSLEDAGMTLDETVFTYDGEEKKPEVTVTLEGNQLEEGIDYRLSYDNNIDAGEGKVMIQGIVQYEGEIEETFIILDKRELEALIAEAKEIDLEDVDPVLVRLLEDAIAQAEDVYENAESVSDVEEAYNHLQEAIERLEEEPMEAAKESLRKLIEEASEVDENAYTEDSMQALKKAIEDGQEVLESAESADELMEAYEKLQEAIMALESKEEPAPEPEPDTKALKELLKEANEYKAEKYTEASFEKLQTAIANAESVIANPESDEIVSEATETLRNAIEGLEKVAELDPDPEKPQTSKLKVLIDRANELNEKDYTEASFALLQKEIKASETVVENPASVEDVKKAYASLKAALENLEKVSKPITPDTSYLEELLLAAKQLDAKDYTKKSYAKVEKAMATAEAVIHDPKSAEAVEQALENLEAALNDLQKIDKKDSEPGEGNKGNKGDSNKEENDSKTPGNETNEEEEGSNKLPATATNMMNNFVIGLFFLLVGIGIYFIRKRVS